VAIRHHPASLSGWRSSRCFSLSLFLFCLFRAFFGPVVVFRFAAFRSGTAWAGYSGGYEAIVTVPARRPASGNDPETMLLNQG
jgi:hypothetical protein